MIRILTKLFLTFFLVQLARCIDLDKTYKINCLLCFIQYDEGYVDDNIKVYPWIVAIFNHQNYDDRYGYGSLVRPNVVFTPGITIYGYEEEELAVEAISYRTKFASEKIKSDYKKSMIRKVVSINYHASHDNNGVYQNYFAFLILESPYLHVNTINIATSIGSINQDNCFMVNWRKENKQNEVIESDWTPVLYNASFLIDDIGNDDPINSDVNENKIPYNICFNSTIDKKLKGDGYLYQRLITPTEQFHGNGLDLIKSEIVFYGRRSENIKIPIRLEKEVLGIPIICPQKNDSKQFVQVGISIILPSTSNPSRNSVTFRIGYFINVIGHQLTGL